MSGVHFQGVTKSFGDLRAVDSLELDIESGEFLWQRANTIVVFPYWLSEDRMAGGGTTEFTVPINFGFAKTFLLGRTPVKTTLQAQYFLTRPDVVGQDWGFFFQITPVVGVPW